MGYKKELDGFTWSFSRIHMYEQCPYAFYLKYIENREGEGNFYAENGSIMHKVFQMLLNHEISLEDAPEVYIDLYDEIEETVQQQTMDKTFNKCLDYLCETEDLDLNKYEILGVEEKLEFKIDKYKFIGYADLILKEKATGRILLIDHKSSDHFLKKNGDVLKSQEENYRAYKKQMYLYCKGIKEKYGFFPDECCWHHFKDSGILEYFPFDEREYTDAQLWAVKTIKRIYRDKHFLENRNYLRCWLLCDYRNDCEYLEDDE